MAKKVLLKSICNVKGSEGKPGDVVTFKSDKQADVIIAGRGGVEVKEDTPNQKANEKKA